MTEGLRFVGVGGLDFSLRSLSSRSSGVPLSSRSRETISISADITPQLLSSDKRRVLQPLDLVNVSRDINGQIVVSFENIPNIKSVNLTQNGVVYPLVINPTGSNLNRLRSYQAESTDDEVMSVTIPASVSSGVADLNVDTDDETYSAKVTTGDLLGGSCNISDVYLDGQYIVVKVEGPGVGVSIYHGATYLGTGDSDNSNEVRIPSGGVSIGDTIDVISSYSYCTDNRTYSLSTKQ